MLSIRKLQKCVKNQNYMRENLYKTTKRWVKKQSIGAVGVAGAVLQNFVGCENS